MSRVTISTTTTTAPPSYICPTAANAIIAEIGPYQVAADALQAINQFLDEFLGLLLSSSLSLDLSRIKTVVFTLLPSTLGKNAIVEAELEVKTFTETEVINYEVYEHMRNLGTNGNPFPLHEALPALRERCVEFCTLAIERPPEEATTTTTNQGSVIIVPIVAIYVTTVLEHVAEYVLTAIAMTAEHEDTKMIRIKEVFLALIDDVQVGGVFYRMVLREKLEKRAYTYGYMPRVMTPVSFSAPKHSSSTAGSIHTGFLDISFDDLELDREDSDYYALRPASLMSSSVSSTTFTSSSAVGLGNKKKTHKVLRKEDEEPLFLSNKSAASVYDPDATAPTTMNFEDMIRSGDTVKVTLTPNRLRSIEVKNQMADEDPPAPTWERRSAASLASRSSRSALRSTSPTPSSSSSSSAAVAMQPPPSLRKKASSSSITTTAAAPLPSPPTTSRSSPFVAPKKPAPSAPALPTPPGPSPSVSTPSVTVTPSVSTPSISLTPAPTPVVTTPQPPSPPPAPTTTTTSSCERDRHHHEEPIKEEEKQSLENDIKPISPPPSSPVTKHSEISISSDSGSDNTITTVTAAADSSNNNNTTTTNSDEDDEKSTTTTTKPPSPRDSVASFSSTKSSSPCDSVVSLSSTSTSSTGFMSAVTAQEEQSGESDNNGSTVAVNATTATTTSTPIPRQPPIRQRKVSRGSKAWESIEETAITPAAAARRRLLRQSRESIASSTSGMDEQQQQQQQPQLQQPHNPPKATPQPRPLSSVLDKVMHFERSMDEFAAQQHHRQHRASAYYPRRERFLYLQREPSAMETAAAVAPPRRPLRRRPVTTAAVDVSVQTTIHENDNDVDDATRELENAVVGWLLGEAV